jgi:hypothetical protein
MSYFLVATFGRPEQAKAACTALQDNALAPCKIHHVGLGAKSLQEVSVPDPNQIGATQAVRMLTWIVPLGFIAGFGFNDITHLTITEQASPLVNHLLGGLLGAGAGAMGGFTFGGGIQFLLDPEKKPFAKRLREGKHLVMVQGSDLAVRQASRILQGLAAESLQVYEDFSQTTPQVEAL